jgi:hypothetical protein
VPLKLARWWTAVVVAGLVVVVLTAPSTPSAAAADARLARGGPGPAMFSSATDRANALTCSGDLDQAQRGPVLLVPGTGLSPQENWGPTYLPVLLSRGHAVCMVRLPAYATRDLQANIEYVATAIRTMAKMSRRGISTIGASQGALLAQAAIRTWPDLARNVDDVIGLAGVYDRGSEEVARRCRVACLPALRQMAPGSAFLRAMHRLPLPQGPTYTNIGSRGDQTVTPQPTANRVPGATSIMVESVCPWHTVSEPQHAMILGDAVALALALDALDHRGTASPGRLSTSTCWEQTYPEFDQDRLMTRRPHTERLPALTMQEPALYSRARPTCSDPRLRGFFTTAPRVVIWKQRVTIRMKARQAGKLRVLLGGRRVDLAVEPGPVVVRIPRPARRAELLLKTRSQFYTAWAVEARRAISAGR